MWTLTNYYDCDSVGLGQPDFTKSPSSGYFNDRVSSHLVYYSCWIKLFEDINYGGASDAWHLGLSSLGAWNDRASSLQLKAI